MLKFQKKYEKKKITVHFFWLSLERSRAFLNTMPKKRRAMAAAIPPISFSRTLTNKHIKQRAGPRACPNHCCTPACVQKIPNIR